MRSLVLAQEFPWPPTSGSFLRLVNVVRALGEVGEVDLFCPVLTLREQPCEVPVSAPVARWTTAGYPPPLHSPVHRLRWVAGNLPLEVASQRFDHPRQVLAGWVRPPYDFVWCSKAPTYAALGRPRFGPTVVDLDDLEDRKIQARLDSGVLRLDRSAGLTELAHRTAAVSQARLNARRWRRLQAEIAAQTEAVVVCSDLDASRIGFPNCRVVPNGYDLPDSPAGRPEVGAPPTVLFQGYLGYGPNADAAQWLVRSIAPALRRHIKDVEVRLVGAPDPRIRQLHDPPRVTVVGAVAEMEPELRRADLVVVPLRYGSGTRVKALEAFANRIPVVSTTLGAEGLEARDGTHLLIADTPEAFASACARLLTDVALRRRLADGAHRLLVSRHQWSSARAAVAALAVEMGAGMRQLR